MDSAKVPHISNSGPNANMYGTTNAARASLHAAKPTFEGFAFAIPAAAYAAIATGGVSIDIQAK